MLLALRGAVPPMTARIRSIDYEHDGQALRGELAWDDAWTEPRPCVVVVHDAMKSTQGFEEERAVTLPAWATRASPSTSTARK